MLASFFVLTRSCSFEVLKKYVSRWSCPGLTGAGLAPYSRPGPCSIAWRTMSTASLIRDGSVTWTRNPSSLRMLSGVGIGAFLHALNIHGVEWISYIDYDVLLIKDKS